MTEDIERATHFSQIDQLLKKLDGGIKDVKLLTTIMDNYRRVRRADKAIDAFDDAKRRGLKLDAFCYSAAIAACARDGQRALVLFDEMRRRGLEPDVISYKVAIAGCEKGGLWQRGVELIDEMLKRGLEP